MPLIFEDESKKLGKKQVIVPDKLVNKIKANLNLFGKYKKTKGFKRANSIVDDEYNKRSNKKDKMHNGKKTISFSDLKRINHDLEHNNQSPNSLENILIGASNKFGDNTINTKTWAKDTLNKLRTSVKQVDAVPPVPKLEKNPLKTKDVQKDLKMGNATVRLTESLDDGEQNSLNKISESIKGNNKEIIIDENKLLLLKEYHAQTSFNFDDEGNGYFAKNNWEHYVDFIEQIGKYGQLPESEWDEYDVLQKIEDAKEDMELDTDDITDYEYETAFLKLIEENYENKEDIFEPTFLAVLYNYDNSEGLDLEHYIYSLDIMDDPCNLDSLLTPYGNKEYWSIIRRNFLSHLDDYDMPYSLKYDNRGLIYVERNIKIPKFNSPNFKGIMNNTSKDYFAYLNNKYDGIGNYFSWAEGNGEAYCGSSYGSEGSSEIKLKCWVDPKNVNWEETVYKNCYDLREEQEIYINDDAPIEIFDIVLECGTENGINVSGKSLLKQPIIVKT